MSAGNVLSIALDVLFVDEELGLQFWVRIVERRVQAALLQRFESLLSAIEVLDLVPFDLLNGLHLDF